MADDFAQPISTTAGESMCPAERVESVRPRCACGQTERHLPTIDCRVICSHVWTHRGRTDGNTTMYGVVICALCGASPTVLHHPPGGSDA